MIDFRQLTDLKDTFAVLSRLIDYPDTEDTLYTYGGPNDSHGAAGKILKSFHQRFVNYYLQITHYQQQRVENY